MIRFRKPKRVVNKVFLHCSDSDHAHHDDIDVIRHWHVEENGWSDVGYHYFIGRGGKIQKGRPLEKTPAAQRGHNTGSIAICVHGERFFTGDQMYALRYLCHKINKAYDGDITFHGHCEVDKNKTCPVFDYVTVLNLNDKGELGYVEYN